MKSPQSPSPSQHSWNRPRRGWIGKFTAAGRGIVDGVRGQSSFFVHVPVAVAVVLAAALLRLSPERWCLLLICIGVVMSAELFNSALEWMSRAIADQHDANIERALNIASGAVLVAAVTAAAVGAILILDQFIVLLAD